MPNEFFTLTWGEFVSWVDGAKKSEYGITAELLRLIAIQQINLNPNVPRMSRILKATDLIKFPTDLDVEVKIIDSETVSAMKKAWKM